jgi:hypothetical protein
VLRRLLWIPALAGPLALIAVLWQFDRFVSAVHWHSDAVATALIAEDLANGIGGHSVLGDVSSLSTLLAFVWTAWLPAHRLLWGAMPYALTLVGVALLALVSYWLAGRWAAAITASLALAVTADVLFTQIAPAFRATTWFSLALLLLFVVVLARGGVRRPALIAAAVGTGLVTGVNAASDPLLVLIGVIPFAIALIPVAIRSTQRRSLTVPLVAFVLGAVAAVTASLATMHLLDLSTHRAGSAYLARARGDLVVTHVEQYWDNLLALAGTTDGTGMVRWWAVPAAVALIATLVTIPVMAVRSARMDGVHPATTAFLTFWSAAVVLLTVGFIVSGTPNGLGGVATDRYLVPLVIAVASVLPVLTASPIRARVVGAIGAAVLVTPGLVTLATADMAVRREAQPQAREATAISTWLKERGAQAGYSDYFTALALTYNTSLSVRTIEACKQPSVQVLCRGVINTRDAWYAPDQRRRTFIILNAGSGNGRALAAALPRAHLPRPIARARFGAITVLVYRGDITIR